MKRPAITALLMSILLALGSCERCADCTCANGGDVNWHDSEDIFTPAQEEQISTELRNEWDSDYPEGALQYCEKKKDDLENKVIAYESGSHTKTEDLPWLDYTFTHTCTCEEEK